MRNFLAVVPRLLLFVASVYLALPGDAIAATIGWPTRLVSSSGNPPAGDPNNVLGVPNGDAVVFGDANSAEYGSFTEIVNYDTGALASALVT